MDLVEIKEKIQLLLLLLCQKMVGLRYPRGIKSFKTCYKGMKIEECIFETPHNEIKCVLGIKESNLKKWVKILTFVYGQG